MLILLIPIGFNILIIIFTTKLIALHIKLIKTDYTAYEYLIYKQDKQDWKDELKEDVITQEQYDKLVAEARDKGK